MNDKNQYPQMTRSEVVQHCKHWVKAIHEDGISLLTVDYGAAITLSDVLAYPLEAQAWITAESEPLLDKIRTYAVEVGNDHTDKAAWEKLVELIEELE